MSRAEEVSRGSRGGWSREGEWRGRSKDVGGGRGNKEGGRRSKEVGGRIEG